MNTLINQQKINILKESLTSRQNEYLLYQINIDNYKLALEEIDNNYAQDTTLICFKESLNKLLQDSITEQKKEFIMITILQKQIEEMSS
jgi:hypothetical protein